MKAILPAALLAAALLSPLAPLAAAPAPPTAPTEAWETAFLPAHVESYAETETVWHLDNQHRLTLVEKNKVQYQQGEKYYIDMQSLVGGRMEHTLGISDGRHFYHYLPSYAKYYKVYANLDLIRCLRPLLQPLPAGKPVRTLLDGKPALLFQEFSPSRSNPSSVCKTWVDARTHLLRRGECFDFERKMPRMKTEAIYSDWKINPIVPASRFTFTPPAGVTEIADPFAADAKTIDKPTPPAQAATLTPGTVAPDFAAQTPDGKTVHLSDYKGRVVVLDFWESWCPACQASLPNLQAVAAQFAPQNVAALAVDVGADRAAFNQWVSQHGELQNIVFAFDSSPNAAQVLHAYTQSASLTKFVIGRNGKIVQAFAGYDIPADDLARAVTAALKE